MNESRFAHLCHEAGRCLGLADPAPTGATGELLVEGVRIALFFDEALAPDRICCYADTGPLDEDRRCDHLEQLMLRNLFGGSRRDGIHALDPVSGHGVLVLHLHDADRIDGAGLASALRACAQQARDARQCLQFPATSAGPAGGFA